MTVVVILATIGKSFSLQKEEDRCSQMLSSKLTKLEFPRYSGDDPTKWFNRVKTVFQIPRHHGSTKSVIGVIPPRR